ncbi:hypothetical protein [Tumebacillus permanentifrigoris]|uniref:Uncharacterized protein n=1 Tax=Tumebacillus permanentifrigoris TaxID=378543 RepID=A0A316DED9_9BACL|nr:hypothetical protein [Tumebacillus permanentifrigoris]PWK16008.1 hypothetical protein C7459_102254 [Tumebacillus permanentifrigoris]
MTERRPLPSSQGLDQQALDELFHMQPIDTNLTPGQKVRRALTPRWEVIIPAAYDPVQEEDRMIDNILREHLNDEQNPGAP